MDGARDWRLLVDLDGKLRVPHKIVETELRPDMLLISDSTKRMGLIELTVPSEDRVEVAGELKGVLPPSEASGALQAAVAQELRGH